MQRRRFFPARPVQQVPGRSVELAVQVRREGVAATAAPPQAPAALELAWVSPEEGVAGDFLRAETNDLGWEVLPAQDDGLTRLQLMPWTPWPPSLVTGWRGVPWLKSARGDALPMTGPGWRCELIECVVSVFERPAPACYTGILTGVPPERVSWELEWRIEGGEAENLAPWDSGPITWGDAASVGGHVARAVGCAVMVYPLWHNGGTWGREALTATAMVDGKAVGTLKFVAICEGW